MPQRHALTEGLSLVFQGITKLTTAFLGRRFTIDGRLVGDIGEVIAELEYDLKLHDISQPDYDAVTPDGRRVQIKATFKDSLTFTTTPDYYLGFKLNEDGTFEEIYNGPGAPIYARFSHRKGIGEKLLSFSNSSLRELSRAVAPQDRIPKRQVSASVRWRQVLAEARHKTCH